MAGGWVYFMTNRRNGVLYVGVTSNCLDALTNIARGLLMDLQNTTA